ncbi:uncharacterized protein LODBEIA_P54660 [Lodderomyces beijingensis]|uniref:GPI transamidase component GPI17 n=1 Tax=Lodderomyces beijingensis TaxID=1775926 RepID=A0ABP0ZV30_9ASCO
MPEPVIEQSKESPTTSYVRNFINALIVVLIVILGYPLFTSTTSIYRAVLPIERINGFDINDIAFEIPVTILSSDRREEKEEVVVVDESYIQSQVSERYPQIDFWSLKFTTSSEHEAPGYKVVIVDGASTSKKFEVDGDTISIFTTPDTNVDEYIAEVLLDHVFKAELQSLSTLARGESLPGVSLPYSANYNLVFSLFVEGGKRISWEIGQALEQFQPVLSALLRPISSFQVSTQIQYYSKLSQLYPNGKIPQDELATFINFGDWNLGSIDINPTINFLIYIPQNHLEIEESPDNAFLVSQWGGVKIMNRMPTMSQSTISQDELVPILEIFANHLLKLLGLPDSCIDSVPLRLESLQRIITFKNLRDSLANLKSLVKLSESLKEITVPEETKQQILLSLDRMDQAIQSQSVSDSGEAVDASNRAFFEKKMVQQAYFPSEHKLAVFLPLLGPVGSIVIFSILKFIKK